MDVAEKTPTLEVETASTDLYWVFDFEEASVRNLEDLRMMTLVAFGLSGPLVAFVVLHLPVVYRAYLVGAVQVGVDLMQN